MRRIVITTIISIGIFALGACGSEKPANSDIDATVVASVEQTVQAKDASQPTATPIPTPSPTPSPTATSVPTSTPEPSPTPTSTPDVRFSESVNATALAANNEAGAASSNGGEFGAWNVTRSVNPLDDSQTIAGVLKADSGVGIYGDPVTLVVRCQSRVIDVYINWASYVNISDVTVTYRVGDWSAQNATWSISTDYESTFYPNSGFFNTADFLRTLSEKDRFTAQVTPYAEAPITAVFNLAGLDKLAPEILSTCGK